MMNLTSPLNGTHPFEASAAASKIPPVSQFVEEETAPVQTPDGPPQFFSNACDADPILSSFHKEALGHSAIDYDKDCFASSLERIAKRLEIKKQIGAATLSAFLQLLAFRWLMLGPANREKFNTPVCLTYHDEAAAIRITFPVPGEASGEIQKTTLVLPFTPQKALDYLQNIPHDPDLEEGLQALIRDFALPFRFVLEKDSPLILEAGKLLLNAKELFTSALELLYHPLPSLQQLAVDMLHAAYALQPDFSLFRFWLELLPDILERESNHDARRDIYSLLERSVTLFFPEMRKIKKDKFLQVLLNSIQNPDFSAPSFVADFLPQMISLNQKKITRSAFLIWLRWSASLPQKQAKGLGLSLYRAFIPNSPEFGQQVASVLLEKKMIDHKEGQKSLMKMEGLLEKNLPLPEQLQAHFSYVHLLKLLQIHFPEQKMPYEQHLFSLLANLLKKEKNDKVLSLALVAGSQRAISDSAFLCATNYYTRVPSPSDSEELQKALLLLYCYLTQTKEPLYFDLYLYLFDTIASSPRLKNGKPQKKIEQICLEIFQESSSPSPEAFVKIMRQCLKSNLIAKDRILANLWLNICKTAWKENIAQAAALWKEGNQMCVWNHLDKKEHVQFLFSFAKDLLETDHPVWRDLGFSLLKTLKNLFKGKSYPELDALLNVHQMEVAPGSSKAPDLEKIFKSAEMFIDKHEIEQACALIEKDLLPNLGSNKDFHNRLQKINIEIFSNGYYLLSTKICLLHPPCKVDILRNLQQLPLQKIQRNAGEIGTLLLTAIDSAEEAKITPTAFRKKAALIIKELLKGESAKKNNLENLKAALQLLHASKHPEHRLWHLVLKKILNLKDVELCKLALNLSQLRSDYQKKKTVEENESSQWIKQEKICIQILYFLTNADPQEFPFEKLSWTMEEKLTSEDPLNQLFPDLHFRQRRFFACLLIGLKEISAGPVNQEKINELQRMIKLRHLIYTYLAKFGNAHKQVKLDTLFVSILLEATEEKTFLKAEQIFLELLELSFFTKYASQEHLDLLIKCTQKISCFPLEIQDEMMGLLGKILNTYEEKMAQHPTLNMGDNFSAIEAHLSPLVKGTMATMLEFFRKVVGGTDDPLLENRKRVAKNGYNHETYSKLILLSQSDQTEDLREAIARIKIKGK